MNKYSEWTEIQIDEEIISRKGMTTIKEVGYPRRMDFAIDLLQECNGSLWFDHVCNLWEVLIEREDDSYIMTNCEQPARAICEAWLLWKDTQQEGAGS